MRREELRIPSPCNADWNAMEPRDRARFCAACELEVVDVSARTETEARALLRGTNARRVCVSYLVNRDGTIRLAPEPSKPDVPASALLRRGARVLAAASIALAACGPGRSGRLAGEPVATVQPVSDEPCERLAGEIAPIATPIDVDAGVATPLGVDAGIASPSAPKPRTTALEPRDDMRMLGELEF